LPDVTLSQEAEENGLRWIQQLQIDSNRTEVTLFEARALTLLLMVGCWQPWKMCALWLRLPCASGAALL